MINRELLIGKVSPFLNKRLILVDNQDTIDIIDALIKNHYKYSKEYDKIYRYFDGGNVEETAYNVWQFLKDNFKYTIEPEKMQILRSPAALLASNIVGIDCKGYATFANGIMEAYKRNSGKNFDIYYRFASYDAFDSTPQHVFSVVKENNKEYWIDPVLDQFDEKKQPYYYKDKKIKNMALVAMSGINKLGVMDIDLVDSLDTSSASSGSYNWLDTILKAAPTVIKAFQPNQPVYTPNQNYYNQPPNNNPINQQPVTKTTEIDTNTILLIGAAGIAAYFLLKKK